MLSLAKIREFYPQYAPFTDYELTRAVHAKTAPDVPFEHFAQQFGGPTEENEETVQVRDYNKRHPDAPIRPEEIGEGSYLNDMGHAFAAGINDTASLPFWLAEKGSELVGLDWLAERAGAARKYFQNSAEEKRKGFSADMKLAQDTEFFKENADGSYSAGDAWGYLPRKVGGFVAESIPSTVAGMGGGGAIAGLLGRMGLSRALSWRVGGAIGEGAVSGAQNSRDAYDAVMTLPEDKLEQSPEYGLYLQSLGDPVTARKALANDIAFAVGWETGAATGILSAGPSAMFGKLLGGEGGKSLGRTMAKQALAEGLFEEAPQSAAEQYLSQSQLRRADPAIDPMQGLGEAAMGGGLSGGVMGAGMGGIGHTAGRRKPRVTPADRLLPEEALQSSGRPVPAAPYVFDQSPENMPVPTGQGVHEGRAVDPDEVLYDEGFVNGTVVSPQGRNDSRPRISGGNTVDLMALPEAQRGLPEGVGIIRMGSESTGRGPIAPPTDFSTPVEQPAAPERLGLPVQPLTGVNPGLWSGGKSQLAYGQPSSPVVNMPSTAPVQGVVGGLSTSAAQPAGGVPMQAPRGDTTAQARQVGMPVPESLPQGSALPRMSVPSLARQPMERPASVAQAVMPAQNTPEVRPVAVRDARSAMPSEQEAVRKALLAKPRPRLLAELPEGAPVTLRNASKEKIVDWLQEHADTRQSGQEQAESVPETSPSLVESGAQDRMETQEQVASRGEAAGHTSKTIRQEGSYAERETVRNAGRDGNEGSTHAGGFLQGERGGDGAAADLVGDRGRGGDGGRAAQSAPQGREGGRTRQPVAIKIPNRADEPAHYELLEADDVRASHLPARGFQKNPAYELENERRYHDEPGSRAKVMENAAKLDPAFLMESVDANHGAPVIDQDNNVLGGNGRAMSIARAYDSFPERGKQYREALKANADRLGIDPAQVDAMRSPVLVRRLERGMSSEERQQLVTAMNDDFKDAREKRASGKSRGDRFGRRTLEMLASGLKNADSLRQYFDAPESVSIVERMMEDGVIQRSERNAYVGADGLLNPDGKKVVEEALRGRVVRSYETLAKLPADVVGKLDAVIPHILVAEGIGKPWNITGHVRDSVDLLVGFRSSGIKDAEVYLKQLDMRTGRAPIQDFSKQAIALFRMALDAKKGEYVKAFESYLKNARLSPEAGNIPGVAKPQDRAFRDAFGMEEEVVPIKPEKREGGKPQAKEKAEEQPPKKAGGDVFGTAFPAFSGKPKEAIEHLIKTKEGHVPAAFHKEGLGDIDLPWGKMGKGGFGLAHIIERRDQSGDDGVAFVRKLPTIISEGKTEQREGFPGRVYVVANDGNAEAVVSLSYLGKERMWLLTGYEYKKTPAERQSDDRPVTATLGDEQRIPSSHSGGASMPAENSGGASSTIVTQKQSVNSESPESRIDRHRNLYKSLLTGKATLEEYRRGFSDLLENEEAVRAELSGMTVKELLERGGSMFAWRHKGDRKADIVDALYRDMLSDFTLGQSYSVSGMMGMDAEAYRKATEASIRRIVDAQSEQTLVDFAKSMAEQREEYASRRKAEREAVENPKTLDDFRSFMRFHMEGKTAAEARELLSFEQRERFDRLAAEASRSSRKTKAEPALSSASQTTDGEIIATRHTQKGHDLFVVRLEDRVSREDYLVLLSSAKRLGGYYSKFRGNGAVPGFQFTERQQAEAFLKLAQGDKAEAQEAAKARRDAFEDDRSQTAVQRLNEMADRLDEDADASLNAARKVNTAKRVQQAATADAAAYANKALAKTMRNIARAIKDGSATFLDRVREKKQVELLRDDLRMAKGEEDKTKYPEWDQREKHSGEPATAHTVEFAAFPHYRLYRSGWAELGRKLMEKDGTRNLGKKILSVADDVTESYLEFARSHLEEVSTYATQDGKPAVFKSREDAEKAIARSGYRGRAVVLPVKRGENRIILSPSAAQERGVWKGDDDRMLSLRPELVDELFDKLGSASHDIPWQLSGIREKRKALARMGIETPAEYRMALREFVGLQEEAGQDKVRELERTVMRDAAKTRGWLDFFPTPAAVTEAMLAAADIRPGMAVLEPSAGMGHIADRIREKGVEPVVAELEPQKRELLEAKGYEVVGKDFMELVPADGGYDRILMNPPFSKRQDNEHVRRAYDMLNPGGRLVAIVSEGSFFGKDRKAAEFRDWLEEVGGTSEKLAEGSFNDPALPVTTGVNTRMVIIEKPDTAKLLASLKEDTARPSDSTPVTVVEVDPGIVPEFKKARDLAKWLKDYFADKREETILSTGKKVRFGNGNLEASIKRVREEAHNQAYAGLNELVRRAEFDSFEAKDARHPNLGGQEVYYSALRIGDALYAVKMKFDVPSGVEIHYRKETLKEGAIEDLRYKDHALREIEIAPVLYRGVVPNNGVPTQATGAEKTTPILYREPAHNKVGFTQATEAEEVASITEHYGFEVHTAIEAIRKISLGVLRDAVKPSRLENGVLSSVKPGEFLNEAPASRRRVRKAAVQSVADALGKRAANAAETRVVQSFEELPRAVRDAYGHMASQVEGVYDTETGTVYLVADNLRNPERAAEVWMHENMVHHGLRGLFGVAGTRRLLNRLWQGMGGMGNAGIAAIARRYGVDPRSDTEGRALVMEEYLASLAEKRAADKLSGQDKTYWRRVVDAVLRAWHALVDAVTGRTGSMKYENVDRLLSALDRYVFEGRPEGSGEGGMVPAMASVDKSGSDMEASRKVWEQLQQDTAEWGRQVDAFRPHQGIGGRQPRLMTVCHTPDVLQKLGAPDLPMTMTADNLGKVLSDKVDHGLPKELVKQLPGALAEPIMVFESASQADSFVVLTELKHEGRSVMAAVHLDTEKQRVRVNDIASAYKRSNEAWYARQMEEGRLLYQDKKKSLAWARTNRLQLPRVRKLPARLRENRILTEDDVVKPIAPSQGVEPLASKRNDPNNARFSPDMGKKTDFVTLPDGSVDFAQFPATRLKDMRLLRAAPIRLPRGIHSLSGGYGLTHIEANHGNEIRAAGYGSVQEFVWDLVNGYNEIWEGEKRSLLILKNNGKTSRPAGFIELEKDGSHYIVKNAYPVDMNYPTAATRKQLWKSAPPSSSTSGEQTPSNPFTPGIPSKDQTGNLQGQRGQSSKENIQQGREEGKPLASLRDIKDVRDITGMSAKDALNLAKNDPWIGSIFGKSGDVTLMQRIFMLPHWMAKRFPGFKAVYDRQLKRQDERAAERARSLQEIPSLFGENKLSGKDMDELKKLVWDNDGKQIAELEGVDKFLTDEELESGRTTIKANPEWYEGYDKWLSRQPGSDAVKKAMREIRVSLDNDLMRAHNRLARMSEMGDVAIQEFRTQIGHIHNYFPHHRYGDYFIQGKDKKGEVVYREHFDALHKRYARRYFENRLEALKKEYPDTVFDLDENTKLPDEAFGRVLDPEAMEQVIKAALSKVSDKEQAERIAEVLHESVADVMKSAGWGSHAIGRKNIPGFEKDDLFRVLYDYKSGLTGWLTKMEASRDFAEALGRINAKAHPQEWSYTSQYVKDMLQNSDRVDRTVGTIKSAAFAWYLGGNIKTAVLNLTQNVIVGVPRLQMDVEGGARAYTDGAQKQIVNQYARRFTADKGKGLSEEEARLIQDLYGDALITDAYMEEVRGQVTGGPASRVWNKFMKVMGYPMSVAERFNRGSLALAAFRAARDGKLKAAARERYGVKGEKATYEQARAFAEEIVRDSHFVYGKTNAPELLRSSTAGRGLGAAFTFKTFTANLLGLWSWALRTQGREGAIMVAKGLGATTALGGLVSLPFYATLMALFQAATGDDDDWTEAIHKQLPPNTTLRDIVCYGLPAGAGVNLGGSLKMELALTGGMQKGSTPKEVLTEGIGDIIGIPWDMFVERPSKVMESMRADNYWRAVEEVVPTAVSNGMKAWRLATEGQKTLKGRDINDPGERGARRLSSGEALGKLLGFQPVSATRSYDAYAASRHSDGVRADKADEVATIMVKALDAGDSAEMVRARKVLKDWNAKMEEEGKPYMRILMKDVQKRVTQRRRQARMTPKARQKGEAFQSVWG